MKNFIIVFSYCVLLSGSSFGQSGTPINKVADAKVIRTVDSLNEVAFNKKRSNLSESFVILNNALVLAKEHNYQRGIATNLLYEAGIFQQNGFEKKALAGFYRALDISKSINDSYNIARANQQIANALQASGKINEAEALFTETMNEYLRLGKRFEVVNIRNSLGSVHLEQGHFAKARYVFEEALKESKKINYPYGIKKSFYNLGLLNIKGKNFTEAKQYFNSSLQLDSQMNDYYGMALSKIQLSYIANQEAKPDEAIALAEQAYDNARTISALQLVSQSIENIIAAYRKKNDFSNIILWQDKLIVTKKELSEQDKKFAVNFINLLKDQQDKQFAIEKRSMEIEHKAEQQLTAFIIIGFALVTLSILAYFWFKNYKKAQTYSIELADKNLQIEKSSVSLELLNKAISKQNYNLAESNLMKDKLLSIISHDLRHPLVNTKGILELVNLNLVDPEETKQLLKQLETQYLRSLTLLDNLLFWIRGQMKGESIDKVLINMKHLIDDILEDHRVALQQKRITTTNNVHDKLFVLGDKEMLKIIFRNLLSNAIKFTPQEGNINVCSSEDDGPVIIITDSGLGMDEQMLSKINSKQYFSTPGTSNESGSGFGLMLCHDLIEKHHGRLTIESKRGKGSVFTVKLPAESEA